MSIMKKISTLDRRWWYAIVVVFVVVPLLNPIGLPLKVSGYTNEAYNTIKALKPNDVVLVNFDVASSGYDEVKGVISAMIPHLFTIPGIKIMFMTDQDQGYIYIQKVLAERGTLMSGKTEFPWYQLEGKQYLVDYVNLGYFPGADKAVASLGADFRGTVGGKDFYKNDITQWMNDAGVQSASDIDLVITIDCGGAVSYFVNYFYLPFGTPIVCAMISVSAAGAITSYNAQQVKAIVISTRGSAEYQYLSGYYGMALVSMDAFSFVQVLLVLLVIVTNVAWYFSKDKKDVK
jgi:hypothetical protein